MVILLLLQLSPEESLRALKTPADLEVTLFAAEPDLVNPTAIDVDSRGRVWVTEAVNYRLFRNPKPRLQGDRIRILEDTDGDGRCDKATTFWEDPSLQSPLSIMVLDKKVYVCQSPEIFTLEDTDGDGRADKKTVVLSGFGGTDSDHGVHGISFGFDGRLILSNGDTGLDVTDKSGGRITASWKPTDPFHAAVVLRMTLDGERMELLAEGLRNPMEPAMDSFGNLFISDNDDDGNEMCRIVHVLEGGRYGFYPRRKGLRKLPSVHWNQEQPGVVPMILGTGAGSPCGLTVYEGSMLPPRIHGTLLHADAGPGVIRSIRTTPAGASFKGEIEILLSCPDDKWFRPIDAVVAPDGSVMVADWYDPGVGGHNLRDWTRGRIYRLARHGAKYPRPDKAPSLASPNHATRYLAHREIAALPPERALTLLKHFHGLPEPHLRARALWLLADCGEAGQEFVFDAAKDKDPAFRALALRVAAGHGAEFLREVWLHGSLMHDPDSGVLRELAIRLRASENPLDRGAKLAVAEHLRRDNNDRFYREAVGISMRGHEAEYFAQIKTAFHDPWDEWSAQLYLQLQPPGTLDVARTAAADAKLAPDLRLTAVRTIAAVGGQPAAEALAALLPDPVLGDLALDLLSRDGGTLVWSGARGLPALQERVRERLKDPKGRAVALATIRDLELTALLADVAALARDAARPVEERVALVTALRHPSLTDLLKELMASKELPIALEAARSIAATRNNATAQALKSVVVDPLRSLPLRKECVRLLGTHKAGTLVLLNLAEERRLPEDVAFDATAAVHASPNEDIRLMAEQLLPLDKSKGGEKLPPPGELLKMKGDAARGREVFFSEKGPQCYKCHQVGDRGATVGPALTKIGAKLARESVFESILNPAAAIAPEYQVWLIETDAQGFLSGYLRSETADTLELVDAAGVTTRLKVADVRERKKSAASIMPSGLSGGMTVQQLVDLADFLQTLK